MGYTPLFSSLFQGSLSGKFPDLYVWMVMLGMADKHGEVDCHPNYIAQVAGISPELVRQAIDALCQPDPDSRTTDEEGRRLLPIPGRGFGWRIVNHTKYREKARKASYDADRTASGVDAARKAAQRASVPTRPAMSRAVPLSDSDANTDTDSNLRGKSAREGSIRETSGKHPGNDWHGFQDWRAAYPAGTFPAVAWQGAERHWQRLLDDGSTVEELLASAQAYAAQQQATGNAGTQWVKRPDKFLADGHWRGPFPLPVTKGEAAQNRNLSASKAWLESERAKDAAAG